jgi:hypothetical protein
MSSNQPSNDEKIIADVTARAAVDRAYRQRLLSSPREALAEVAGMQVPKSFTVKFVEKDPSVDAMFVLPDLIDPNGELSAEELEAVAGGASDCWFTCGNTCQGCSNSITNKEVSVE